MIRISCCSAPSIWYLAHLEVTDEFDEPRRLIGVSLPGTPYVLLGRGNDIAWGFTNTATDAQDVFIERVNPSNPDEYLAPTGWVQCSGRKRKRSRSRAAMHAFSRGAGPVMVRCCPPVTSILTSSCLSNTVAALQWTALAHDDTTALVGPGFMACGRSRTSRTALMPS
jgi:penicillin amidase